MSTDPQLALSGFGSVVALPAGIGFALAAEQPSAEQIIRALKPPRVTRGLSTAPRDTARAVEDNRFIDTLRNRTTRSLTTDERSKIASIAKDKPSIDLEINFELNSAIIGPKAMPQITALGEALTSPDLKGRTFVLAGHTDALGDPTLQSEPIGATLGCGEAVPGGKVRNRGEPFADRRARQDPTEECIQSLCSREPTRADRQRRRQLISSSRGRRPLRPRPRRTAFIGRIRCCFAEMRNALPFVADAA